MHLTNKTYMNYRLQKQNGGKLPEHSHTHLCSCIQSTLDVPNDIEKSFALHLNLYHKIAGTSIDNPKWNPNYTSWLGIYNTHSFADRGCTLYASRNVQLLLESVTIIDTLLTPSFIPDANPFRCWKFQHFKVYI